MDESVALLKQVINGTLESTMISPSADDLDKIEKQEQSEAAVGR